VIKGDLTFNKVLKSSLMIIYNQLVDSSLCILQWFRFDIYVIIWTFFENNPLW